MHYQKKIIEVRVQIFVMILLSFDITALQANVITNGCADTNVSCTLDELVGGGSIVIDEQLFDGWFINDFSTSATNLGHIDVLALANDPLSPGLLFDTNSEFSVVGFDVIDFTLGFSVSTLNSSTRITGNDLEINGFTFGSGNIGGFINIWEDVFDANGALIGEEYVEADNLSSFFNLYDSATFTSQSQVFVEKTIFLSGGDPLDTVSLDSFSQRFVQVPEPSAFWLMMIGLTVVFVSSGKTRNML